MTANTILYRYTNPGDNYTSPSFTDLIQLDFGTIPTPTPPGSPTFSNPDKTGHAREIIWSGQISLQENPKPNINNPHDIQDLGISSFTAELHGYVEYPAATKVPGIVLSWLQDFRANNNFPFGRFGITTVDFPAFNAKPSTTAGYMLEYVEMTRPGDWPKIDMTLRFKFNGTISQLGIAGP